MDIRNAMFGRLQFTDRGRTLGVFTVDQDGYTYVLLAEFVVNKWQVYWSMKTADLDSVFLNTVALVGSNMYNFFAGTDPTENVNDEAAAIVSRL